jgi:hypothetical protein
MDIEHDPEIRLERDGGAVRQVLHLSKPFAETAATSPTDLAALYLHVHADVLGIDRASLPSVPGMPPLPLRAILARLLGSVPLLGRLLWPLLTRGARLDHVPVVVPVRQGKWSAVIFREVLRVYAGWWSWADVAVWGAGIRISVPLAPRRVTSVYSTLLPDPPPSIASSPLALTVGDAVKELDIPPDEVEGLFIDRVADEAAEARATRFVPALVRGRIVEARRAEETPGRALPYREFVDLESGQVGRREVLASSAITGRVFKIDPRSQTATPRPRPSRPAGELDPFRVDLALEDLTAPSGGVQTLVGQSRVAVAQTNPLGINPPTRPAGANFNYTSRSDHFAAVSAYRHCEAAFRMLEALGYPLAEYFDANANAGKLPIRVVHRAPIPPGRGVFDGRVLNAQVVSEAPPNQQIVREMRFGFGDLSDPVKAPLGIAADVRFVWHEFCHALLIAGTGSPEFPFAHSAGDALAAIICDLDSKIDKLAHDWRGVTFPWVEALRRHDRKAEDGWSWHGTLYSPKRDIRDPGGYRGEQVLSSTLFRLYRALGGDAQLPNGDPNLAIRRAAAAYTVYLVVTAIKALGPAAMVPGVEAYALAGAMIDVDIHQMDPWQPDGGLFPPLKAPEPRRGGAVHKVVRWAFERQGLWAPPTGPRPWDKAGEAELVDAFIEDPRPWIEDSRRGTYEYTPNWEAQPPHLLIASQPVLGSLDSPPHRNVKSFVFVRVQNRGTDPNPGNSTVTVFVSREGGGGPSPWHPAGGGPHQWVALPAQPPAVVTPGGFADFGPFEWQPSHQGAHGLLACVDTPADRCNAFVAAYACATGPTPLDQLVPFDNNIGYRRVIVQN